MGQPFGVQDDDQSEPEGVGMGGQAEDYQGTDNAETVRQLGRPETVRKAIRKAKVRRSSGKNQRLDVYVHLVAE